MSVNVLQQRTATQGYDIMGGGTKQPVDITVDNSPTADSTNPVSSGGVYTALESKQDTLTFDDAPTNGSDNPVKSDGIFDALEEKIGFKKVDLAINPSNSYITVSNNCYLLVSYILGQCDNVQIDPTKPLFIGIKPQNAPKIYSYMIMNLKKAESSSMYFEINADGVIYGADATAIFDQTKGFGLMGGSTGSSSAAGIPTKLFIAGFTN